MRSDDVRAPSCDHCVRRESALVQTMHLYGSAGEIALAIAFLAMGMLVWSRSAPDTQRLGLWVALYMTASPAAIVANKTLMKDVGFGYPVTISALGQLCTALSAWLVGVHDRATLVNAVRELGATTLGSLGGLTALSLVLGQYPYFYLTVAFIQMLKAFAPVYLVICLFCFGIERPSRSVVACAVGMSMSACVASLGEINLSPRGMMWMVLASLSDSFRLVLVHHTMRGREIPPVASLQLVSTVCLLFMLPVGLVVEAPVMLRAGSALLVSRHPMLFLVSGAAGAAVNYSSFLVVKHTSAVTLKALTMTRNAGLVLVAAVFMGEQITRTESVGYVSLVACFCAYTNVKMKERASGNDDITPLIEGRGEQKC